MEVSFPLQLLYSGEISDKKTGKEISILLPVPKYLLTCKD
jgi:hypothetical protein